MRRLSECEKGYRRWISPTNKKQSPKKKGPVPLAHKRKVVIATRPASKL